MFVGETCEACFDHARSACFSLRNRHFSLVKHAETWLDHVFSLVFPMVPGWTDHGRFVLSRRAPPTIQSEAFFRSEERLLRGGPLHPGNIFLGGIGSIWATSWYGAFQWYIYLMVCIYIHIYMGLSLVMGVQNSWMVYFMENPPQLLGNLHIFLGEWPSSSTSYDLPTKGTRLLTKHMDDFTG